MTFKIIEGGRDDHDEDDPDKFTITITPIVHPTLGWETKSYQNFVDVPVTYTDGRVGFIPWWVRDIEPTDDGSTVTYQSASAFETYTRHVCESKDEINKACVRIKTYEALRKAHEALFYVMDQYFDDPPLALVKKCSDQLELLIESLLDDMKRYRPK